MDQMGYTRRESTRIDIEKAMVTFYNRIAQAKVEHIGEIPIGPLSLLLNMTYEELAAGMIRESSQQKKSIEKIRIKWGFTERILRRIAGRK